MFLQAYWSQLIVFILLYGGCYALNLVGTVSFQNVETRKRDLEFCLFMFPLHLFLMMPYMIRIAHDDIGKAHLCFLAHLKDFSSILEFYSYFSNEWLNNIVFFVCHAKSCPFENQIGCFFLIRRWECLRQLVLLETVFRFHSNIQYFVGRN